MIFSRSREFNVVNLDIRVIVGNVKDILKVLEIVNIRRIVCRWILNRPISELTMVEFLFQFSIWRP